MKRINVFYDGEQYSIGNRTLPDMEKQISDALLSGIPSWLDVNIGEGAPHAVRLLIHPGIAISLSPVDNDNDDDTPDLDRNTLPSEPDLT